MTRENPNKIERAQFEIEYGLFDEDYVRELRRERRPLLIKEAGAAALWVIGLGTMCIAPDYAELGFTIGLTGGLMGAAYNGRREAGEEISRNSQLD